MKLYPKRNAVPHRLKTAKPGRGALPRGAARNALLWIAAVAVLSMPAASRAAGDAITGREILMLVAARDFDFQEYRLTAEALIRNGCSITIASTETTAAIATNDTAVKPDLLLSQVDLSRYSALILVGGIGSVLFWDDSATLALLRAFSGMKESPIGAIGIAPLILAKAGLLKGRSAAVYNDPRAAKILADNGAKFSFRDVVADGRFITARGSDAAVRFVQAIVTRLDAGK